MNINNDDLLFLYYLQKYGFLTIKQAVKIANLSLSDTRFQQRLVMLEKNGFAGSFGNKRYGMTVVPKIYFLKEKGYNKLLDEKLNIELLGDFKKKNKPGFSPKFNHRIFLIDAFLALEIAVRNNAKYDLEKVFLEYNKEKYISETTDHISEPKKPQNRITPDGAFILKNIEKNTSRLHFVEVDMGTETIQSIITKNPKFTLYNRMKQYDEYLKSRKYEKKYKKWGKFNNFRLLFITTSTERVENIRRKTFDLNPETTKFYMFNTHEIVSEDFFNNKWRIRSVEDNKFYGIVS
jgi:hypothetical protein